MALTALNGTLGRKRAAHLLRRACGGASTSDIDTFENFTADQAIDVLIRENMAFPEPPIDPQTSADFVTSATTDANSKADLRRRYLKSWILAQMLGMDIDEADKLSYQFRERISFFYHTFFTTELFTVGIRTTYFQNALLRFFAFDEEDTIVPDPESTEENPLPDQIHPVNIKQLAKKISVDNAMLKYLNGNQNTSGRPNENYARELLELYSIGRGLEGHIPEGDVEGDYFYFTEDDVLAAANALSGFNNDDSLSILDIQTGLPRGIANNGGSTHDYSTKTFSNRFNNATVAPNPDILTEGGNLEDQMIDEVSQLVDLIFEQDQTPVHICRKLYRFFVYHEVTPEVEAGMIADMVQILVDNDFKIIPVLRALLTSQEFYDGGAGVEDNFNGSIIKSPVDLCLGFINNFEIEIPSPQTALTDFYDVMAEVLGACFSQGMSFYDPIEVAGYAAYHQYPIYNRSWITPNYLTNRYNFINQRVRMSSSAGNGSFSPYDFVKNRIPDATASNARTLIIALAEYFLPAQANLEFEDSDDSELTTQRLQYFLSSFLMNPQIDDDPEAAWTTRWTNGFDVETQENQLMNLFNTMLQSPEYQLM